MESLLFTLVIVVAILILVVLVIPDRLERRALENQALRATTAADLAAVAADTTAVRASLAPYRSLQSTAYAHTAAALDAQLSQLEAEQQAVARRLAALQLPVIPRLALPVQHFVVAPADASAVFTDATRLGQMRRAVQTAANELAAAHAAFEQFGTVPPALRAESQAVLRRLDAVAAALRVEERAGIEQLADLDQALGAQQSLVAGLEQRFHARTPLAELDAAALELEAAIAATGDLEARVSALNRSRLQLDKRLLETAGELDDIQVMAKSGAAVTPVSRPARALLLQAAVLLNEQAPEARRVHDFARAEDQVTAAHDLIRLARNLSESERQLAYLEANDAGLGLGAEIAVMRRELAGLLLRLSPATASPEAMSALAGAEDRADLAARSADLIHELNRLALQQREAIAMLERDAVADRDRVVEAWEKTQAMLALSNEDPLVGRYQRVLAQFTAARGDPAALQAARKDAAEFLATQREWSERLNTQRRWQTDFRAELPRLVDRAIAESKSWACLQPGLAAIQQRVADFSQLQARFNKARTTSEALAVMDQFERLESDVRREYEQLAGQAARLRWLEDDLTKTLALVAVGEDDPAAPRRARTQQMIDHRVAQAHEAARCEDAVQAMLWAAELAQNLST